VNWSKRNKDGAPSQWFDQANGTLARDESGNVTGGIRYGLIAHPLGHFRGATAPGAVYGSVDLISADEFAQTYGNRETYLALISEVDASQIAAGYLTEYGAAHFRSVANLLMDRIGVPAAG
jgi:hypothetical protein